MHRAPGLLLLATLPACSALVSVPTGHEPVPDEVLQREFTPQELAADVDGLFAIPEDVHPDLYAVLTRDERR